MVLYLLALKKRETARRGRIEWWKRLQAVLDKITNTTLDTSSIDRIKSLMKNVHKKGICHILVNDGTINSWVDIDE